MKLSGKTKDKKDQFYINYLTNTDSLDKAYLSEEEEEEGEINDQSSQKREQNAIAGFYTFYFPNESSLSLSASYSELQSRTTNNLAFFDSPNLNGEEFQIVIDRILDYKISTADVDLAYSFPFRKNHNMTFGVGLYEDKTSYTEVFSQEAIIGLSSPEENQEQDSMGANRLGVYWKDYFNPISKLQISPGIRVDYSFLLDKAYVQPRIQMRYTINKAWKWTAALGRYHQFINKISLIDDLGNINYLWNISDSETIPVTSGNHYNSGISYKKGAFQITAEGFYKKIKEISVFRVSQFLEDRDLFVGESQMYGLDLYSKINYKKNEFWFSYTWSEVRENFPDLQEGYLLAPHHQRHEFKVASLFHLKPFFLSANYVYGSGLHFTKEVNNGKPIPYNRFDLALLYPFSFAKVKMDVGISLLNVFDVDNIKYTNFNTIDEEETIYSPSTPMTALLNLNLKF